MFSINISLTPLMIIVRNHLKIVYMKWSITDAALFDLASEKICTKDQ